MNTLSASVYCVTALGLVGLPFISRRAKTVEELEAQIDEDLHTRLCEIVACPGWDWLSDREALAIIQDSGGMKHLLTQTRLLMAIAVEMRKDEANVHLKELDQIGKKGRAIETLLKHRFGELFRSDPHAQMLIELFTDCAGSYYSISVDSSDNMS